MNIVIIKGKIIEKQDIKFIYNQGKKTKHITIIELKIEVERNNIIEAYAYDDIADKLYQENLKEILMEGKLNSKMQIEIFLFVNLQSK